MRGTRDDLSSKGLRALIVRAAQPDRPAELAMIRPRPRCAICLSPPAQRDAALSTPR
jgi:hypothetical protein